MIIFVIAAMLIAVVAVVFALQNTATVTVSFLVWTLPGSQALVLLAALFSGIAVCFLAFLPSWIRHRWTIRQLRKRVTMLEMSLSDQEAATQGAKQKLWDQSQAVASEQKLPDPTPPAVAGQKPPEQIPAPAKDEPAGATPPPAKSTEQADPLSRSQ